MILGATAGSPVPMVNRKTLRRTLLWAAVAGVIGLGVAIALGQPVAGLLGLLGLALGAANARAAQVSVARYSDRGEFSKGRFAISVLGRLGVITVIALGCAVLLRPTGLAVFAGLAVFQLLTIVSAMLPLVKEIRQS
ncbi:hypothetical protein BKA01_001165 [Pseudonocardia eucalypti]|nr:hypothetical protein [Pseudonocardia eucalypti]